MGGGASSWPDDERGKTLLVSGGVSMRDAAQSSLRVTTKFLHKRIG
jgi:hypothetical protein